MAQVGLQQGQAQVPLGHAAGLDHIGVIKPHSVHDHLTAALDGLHTDLEEKSK